jgi:peptidyl-prolyl cis-trans isomerase SurA
MKKISCTFFALVIAMAVFAQPQKVVADKIIAVVGNKVILKSDIDTRIQDLQRQGSEIPENVDCLILAEALGTKALVLQAEKDSLPVTDEEIEAELDNRVRYFMQQYGGKDELEKIAGKSIYQIKEDLRTPIRDQKLAGEMRRKVIADIRITPNEVRAYFEKIPTDSLTFYETELEIGSLAVFPKASKDADDYCKEQLLEYKAMVENGKKDFKQAAAQYSEEPGAAERFGQMEVNRNQKDIDPAFLSKVYTLKEGQISNPFRSKFGFHIIQLVSRQGDDALVRHIIKIPKITKIELEKGLNKLDSVRAKLIAGTIDFGSAVNRYGEDESVKFTGGMMSTPDGTGNTFLTIDMLDQEMVKILNKLPLGGYSQPQVFADAQGKQGVRILYLKTKTQPHRENLRDDYSKISERALNEKKERYLEKWFLNKIENYYLKIDPQYKNCEALQIWLDALNKKK